MKTTITGRSSIDKYEESCNLSLKGVTPTQSILVTQPGVRCPLRDHPVCENTHWRSGQEFEHMRRCPQHEFSWEPGDWYALCISGAQAPASESAELLPSGTTTYELKLVAGETTWFVQDAASKQIRKIVLKKPAPVAAA